MGLLRSVLAVLQLQMWPSQVMLVRPEMGLGFGLCCCSQSHPLLGLSRLLGHPLQHPSVTPLSCPPTILSSSLHTLTQASTNLPSLGIGLILIVQHQSQTYHDVWGEGKGPETVLLGQQKGEMWCLALLRGEWLPAYSTKIEPDVGWGQREVGHGDGKQRRGWTASSSVPGWPTCWVCNWPALILVLASLLLRSCRRVLWCVPDIQEPHKRLVTAQGSIWIALLMAKHKC